jgi:hypothetical protein
MSRQRHMKLDKQDQPFPLRSKQDAVALKAIWLDVDVKAPPKGYVSLEEAIDALEVFRKAASLPPPDALISSGGGLHVYWISERSLAVGEWQPYANALKACAIQHGLRCDAGVTVDAARILRVPGTFNYKNGVKRPVKVRHA